MGMKSWSVLLGNTQGAVFASLTVSLSGKSVKTILHQGAGSFLLD